MRAAMLMLWLAGPPEPAPAPMPEPESAPAPEAVELAPVQPTADAPTEPTEPTEPAEPAAAPASAQAPARAEPAHTVEHQIQPPPPTMFVPPPEPPSSARPRLMQRCLPGVDPCVRTHAGRLLLSGLSLGTSAVGLYLLFSGSDRNRIGDPDLPLVAGGFIGLTAAVLGATVAGMGGDGPALPDRITVPTVALGLSLGGSDISDEQLPSTLTASVAPTWQFPNSHGRLRFLGNVGGRLGTTLDRDPRPQTAQDDSSFAPILTDRRMRFDVGLDLAVKLPYPVGRRRPAFFGQFELRYKPLFFYGRDALTLDTTERVSQRVMLTPLNLGFRWHLSPRQRFTFYLGPRWDMIGYGSPGQVAAGKPVLGPLYSESWFDLDIPLGRPRERKLASVGQLTLGYVHSRWGGNGLDFGTVVGFFGQVVAQFAVRMRPAGSPVAYQLELGARIGGGLNPFVRVGVVLPDIGGKKR